MNIDIHTVGPSHNPCSPAYLSLRPAAARVRRRVPGNEFVSADTQVCRCTEHFGEKRGARPPYPVGKRAKEIGCEATEECKWSSAGRRVFTSGIDLLGPAVILFDNANPSQAESCKCSVVGMFGRNVSTNLGKVTRRITISHADFDRWMIL